MNRDGFFSRDQIFPNDDGIVDEVAVQRAIHGDDSVLDAMNFEERRLLLASLSTAYNRMLDNPVYWISQSQEFLGFYSQVIGMDSDALRRRLLKRRSRAKNRSEPTACRKGHPYTDGSWTVEVSRFTGADTKRCLVCRRTTDAKNTRARRRARALSEAS